MAESANLAALREQVAGLTEDEIRAGMRDGSIDTGAVIGALIESGQITIDAPGEPLHSTEEVAAELGIDL